ncbi:hypothetical protein [Pantoea ananatis]|uniref:hypothetical protein n=1 Tax=Pantoea ananas TaxID=553 RepID=UPI001F4DBA5A|nr:hypothetical protein [Pantoea ananatis]MCH9271900.1 hypothetical protein [Pantoea ananatis]
MTEVDLYDISQLNRALFDDQAKRINVFFIIKDEDLISICRLFSFRDFVVHKNKTHLTISFEKIKPVHKGNDFVIQFK